MVVLWFIAGLLIGLLLGVLYGRQIKAKVASAEMVAGVALKSEEQYIEDVAAKVKVKLQADLARSKL